MSEHKNYKFPKDFLWGAATSSHQVEGDNSNNDWWEWENSAQTKHKSGRACRHYEFFEKDFDLAKSLNHNAHRFSIEWSRIEPNQGEFCMREIEHYKNVVSALKKHCIEPVVTLHHFTNPIWFAKQGGWKNKKSIDWFSNYAARMAEELSDVKYWITINEPMVYIYHSFVIGIWPPQEKSIKMRRIQNNMIKAHISAYKVIHELYNNKSLPTPKVSIAKHLLDFVPFTNSFRDRFAANLRNRLFNFSMLDKLSKANTLDFIGVNYYTRNLAHTKGWTPANLTNDICTDEQNPYPKNFLGWDIYPQGLFNMLVKLKKYNAPVMITENGICTADDNQRWEFIKSHLIQLAKVRSEGINIIGYLYWSLLDNFEWHEGYAPRFGLINVDYTTFERTVRESARKFASICSDGCLR